MRLPKKLKPEFYRAMLEARRWQPILEEMAPDTPPPARRPSSPLVASRWKLGSGR